MSDVLFQFDNSLARSLPGLYVPWRGDGVPQPKVLRANRALAQDLRVPYEALFGEAAAQALTGAHPPEGAQPLAMAYAGHQFGRFVPLLGDGRALLLGEVIDAQGQRRDIHLKGSGPTPFSRGGDGKAALGPVLREYLMGEAMHALGIATTRALAVLTTGQTVWRQDAQPGAILVRVARSHVRVGSFQLFAAADQREQLRQLADYVIARHDPDLADQDGRYLQWLGRVCAAQAQLVAAWMSVGFVHGVMNTDNLSIAGETLDYGPCAFMEAFDPDTVFSSIDRHGRYAYGQQPPAAQWGLARLAQALLPLLEPDDSAAAMAQVADFAQHYERHWLRLMRAKLGLAQAQPDDQALIDDWLALMRRQRVDFTQGFRALSDALRGRLGPLRVLLSQGPDVDVWIERYLKRAALEGIATDAQADAMDRVNPLYIARNHQVEAALSAAIAGDLEPFDRLLRVVSAPFEARDAWQAYAQPAPAHWGRYVTYCGT